METWNEIPDFGGYYSASNQGRVRRNAGSPRCKKHRILKPMETRRGYLSVGLSVPWRKQRPLMIHRLVLEAFGHRQPSPKHEVNHINGDKQDNRLENLEWATRSENIKHAYDTGLHGKYKGSKAAAAILDEQDVVEILGLAANRVYQKDIAAKYGVSIKTVCSIVNGDSWKNVPRPSGLTNRRRGRHILTEPDVVEIKLLLNQGQLSHGQIASKFGVSGPTIWQIAAGRTWQNV